LHAKKHTLPPPSYESFRRLVDEDEGNCDSTHTNNKRSIQQIASPAAAAVSEFGVRKDMPHYSAALHLHDLQSLNQHEKEDLMLFQLSNG
jgi:hypothetical protein